ncbi:MAG: hypothetical protein ACR2KV_01055 [Solirubrobacteraceae bacterium]
MCCLASSALAGVAVSAAPDAPRLLAVGQTRVPSSLAVGNASIGAEAAASVTLERVTLVLGCGTQTIAGADCPLGSGDPGALRLGATITGQAGTACAGLSFAASLIDPLGGEYLLTPSGPVVLGPAGAPDGVCIVNLTLDVLRAPAIDADAAAPGIQIDLIAGAAAVNAGGVRGGGFGSDEVTIDPGVAPVTAPVAPAPPTAPAPAVEATAASLVAVPAAVTGPVATAAAAHRLTPRERAAHRQRPRRHLRARRPAAAHGSG